MMGKPTKNELEIKIQAANKAVDTLIQESTPIKNECTEKKVREKANKIIAVHGFKNISRSTILQSDNPEWIAINKRIQDYKNIYSRVKKVANKDLKEKIKELEEISRNQNTKLLEYLTTINKLKKKDEENEQTISDLIDQIQDHKGKNGN